MEERILCSAIHFDDWEHHAHQPINILTGFVVCGLRHNNCYTTASIFDAKRNYKSFDAIQGFLTNKNRFVDRIEGMKIAIESGQVKEGETRKEKWLFSEDLW